MKHSNFFGFVFLAAAALSLNERAWACIPTLPEGSTLFLNYLECSNQLNLNERISLQLFATGNPSNFLLRSEIATETSVNAWQLEDIKDGKVILKSTFQSGMRNDGDLLILDDYAVYKHGTDIYSPIVVGNYIFMESEAKVFQCRLAFYRC